MSEVIPAGTKPRRLHLVVFRELAYVRPAPIPAQARSRSAKRAPVKGVRSRSRDVVAAFFKICVLKLECNGYGLLYHHR